MRLCKCGKEVVKYHRNGVFKSYMRTCGSKACQRPTEQTKEKIRQGNKGKIYSPETRRKISESKRGEKSHFWRGGVSSENEKFRKSVEYKLWREAVYSRDNWTCCWCFQRGGTLQADHIKPWAYFPELRFAIDNGRTLCVDCHKRTDTYGVNAKYYA